MRLQLSRVALRFLRTARYLADLLVWSRVFVVRRTSAQIEFNAELRNQKGVAHHQPRLVVTGRNGARHFEQGFNIVSDILFANLHKATATLPLRHAVPAPAFAGIYLWDSAFIALIWQHWDRDVAFDVIESVVAVRQGDRLQHVVADFVRSDFTQPPLIAWAAMRMYDGRLHSQERLRRLYEPLVAYHHWMRRHRRLSNGLYFWIHPYESGVENAPRFSSRDESELADTTRLAAPDLCTYMVLQCEALASMARAIGRRDAAMSFDEEARQLRRSIQALLWHEQDALYYDLDLHTGEFVRSRTIASLLPLAAGVPDAQQAARMCELICNPAVFGSPLPLPSVALDDPAFEKDMWRGPVWINTAYLVLEGLRRYGFDAAYATLAWRLCDGVFRVLELEHQVYEFYDPEQFHTRDLRRKKGNWWKAFTLGTGPQKDFVGWSGLVNTLVVEALLGYRRTSDGCQIQPRLPAEAKGFRFTLWLPQDDTQLHLWLRADGRIEGTLSIGDTLQSFDLAQGQVRSITLLAASARAA